MPSGSFHRIAVIGTGAFGTAMANHISLAPTNTGLEVILYGREANIVEEINHDHTNQAYLPGVTLSDQIKATGSLQSALADIDLLILAVPAQHIRDAVRSLKPFLSHSMPVLSLAKGVEKKSGMIPSDIISVELSDIKIKGNFPVAALSGPSFAKDVARGFPVGISIASKNRSLLIRLQQLLHTPLFDVKVTKDLAGVQTGGSLKNVFGIVAGVLAGSHSGDSIIGDYFTRSMVEMRDVGMFLGGRWSTFSGRSGLGDLTITCTPSSRNFRFGKIYAETFRTIRSSNPDFSIEEVHEETFQKTVESLGTRTVEGYDTIAPVFELVSSHRIFTPILRGIHRLLYIRDIAPDDLLNTIRSLDMARKQEGLPVFSIVMHELFPRFWFRRG